MRALDEQSDGKLKLSGALAFFSKGPEERPGGVEDVHRRAFGIQNVDVPMIVDLEIPDFRQDVRSRRFGIGNDPAPDHPNGKLPGIVDLSFGTTGTEHNQGQACDNDEEIPAFRRDCFHSFIPSGKYEHHQSRPNQEDETHDEMFLIRFFPPIRDHRLNEKNQPGRRHKNPENHERYVHDSLLCG